MHLLSPVGPLPAKVYWRRRAVVVGAVVLLLLLLRACTSGGSPEAEQLRPTSSGVGAQPGAPATTGTGASGAPAPVTTPALPSTTASASAQPSRSPAAVPPCPDRALSVVAGTDASVYPLGSTPRLSLTVRNTGAGPCRRALGPGAVELRVVSGADRVWSSDDCSPGGAQGIVTLEPRAARTVAVVWPARRSAPGCNGPGAKALPGTYRVVAVLGTYASPEKAFTLAES